MKSEHKWRQEMHEKTRWKQSSVYVSKCQVETVPMLNSWLFFVLRLSKELLLDPQQSLVFKVWHKGGNGIAIIHDSPAPYFTIF